jgi:hypothetical protein
VVRRIVAEDLDASVAAMQSGGSGRRGAPAGAAQPEPEPEPAPPTRRTSGMPPLFASSSSSSGRLGAMRSQMKQAMQKEEDPHRLTELVLESMEFGDALETERTALQVIKLSKRSRACHALRGDP